jgi:hypothetical protein
VEQAETNVLYAVEVVTEEGTDNGNPTAPVAGHQARGYLKIPAHTNTIAIELTTAVVKDSPRKHSPAVAGEYPGEWDRNETCSRKRQQSEIGAPKLSLVTRRLAPNGGDEFYRIEHFPVPKEIELRDWNGLVVQR